LRFHAVCGKCAESVSIDIEETEGFSPADFVNMTERYRGKHGERLDEEKLKNLLEEHETSLGNRKKIEAHRECPKCGAQINFILWVALT
jgi:hypothetical protein